MNLDNCAESGGLNSAGDGRVFALGANVTAVAKFNSTLIPLLTLYHYARDYQRENEQDLGALDLGYRYQGYR